MAVVRLNAPTDMTGFVAYDDSDEFLLRSSTV